MKVRCILVDFILSATFAAGYPEKPDCFQQAVPCWVCSKQLWRGGVLAQCACGRPCVIYELPEHLRKHKDCMMSVASKMRHQDFQDSREDSIANENASDNTCFALSQVSDTDTEDGMAFEMLGMLVAVADDAASDFVFGPHGTSGRPDGVPDIGLLSDLDSSGLLGSDGHNRWTQFLHVWQSAGWSLQTLLQVADKLRPLQYGSALEMADLVGVKAEQLNSCIAEYRLQNSETHNLAADKLTDFLAIIQQNFSQYDSVLLLAEDAVQRLSKVQIA